MKTDPAPPLRGRVVAITRPREQGRGMAELVARLGGVPLVAPTVEIRPPEDREGVLGLAHETIRGEIDIVVFLSVNSVRSLFQAAEDAGLGDGLGEALEGITVVAIGEKTENALRDRGVKAGIIPAEHTSRGVLESLAGIDIEGLRIGMPRSSRADETLRVSLEARGAKVREVTAYESGAPSDTDPALSLIDALGRGEADAVTFTSASTGRNLFEIAEEHGRREELKESLRGSLVAAIGPATRRALEGLGVRVDVVPGEHTSEALIWALAEKWSEQM